MRKRGHRQRCKRRKRKCQRAVDGGVGEGGEKMGDIDEGVEEEGEVDLGKKKGEVKRKKNDRESKGGINGGARGGWGGWGS